MKLNLLAMFATAPFLFACAAPEPRPQLATEGKEVVVVFSEPHEFLMRGLRGSQNIPPKIQTVQFKFQCLKDFDGRSAQTRADASAQYADIYHKKSEDRLMLSRIMFGWISQIEDRSIAEQGCEVYPDLSTKTIIYETVSADPAAVVLYAMRNDLL